MERDSGIAYPEWHCVSCVAIAVNPTKDEAIFAYLMVINDESTSASSTPYRKLELNCTQNCVRASALFCDQEWHFLGENKMHIVNMNRTITHSHASHIRSLMQQCPARLNSPYDISAPVCLTRHLFQVFILM